MKEPWVRSLGCEDPLEKGMVTHSSILAWRTARTEEPGGLPSMGSQEPDTTEQVTHTHTQWRKEGTAAILLQCVMGVVAR